MWLFLLIFEEFLTKTNSCKSKYVTQQIPHLSICKSYLITKHPVVSEVVSFHFPGCSGVFSFAKEKYSVNVDVTPLREKRCNGVDVCSMTGLVALQLCIRLCRS
jgi:hypothetical protein